MSYRATIRSGDLENIWMSESVEGHCASPVFPAQLGLRLHTYALDNPEYAVTNRYHGTTDGVWNMQSVIKSRRDALWAFWADHVERGSQICTFVDHRSRYLFEASWNDWSEVWSTSRGGVFELSINFAAPVPWTVPCWGFWPMVTSSPINHNLSGSEIAIQAESGGSTAQYADDTDVLRKTGYAFRIAADGSLAAMADIPLGWRHQDDGNKSVTLFAQVRIPEMADSADAMNVVLVAEGPAVLSGRRLAIQLKYVSSSACALSGLISDGSSTNTVSLAGPTYPELTVGEWYTVALTYNAMDKNARVYYYAEDGEDGNFLEGTEDQGEGILSTESDGTVVPGAAVWGTATILHCEAVDLLASAGYAQNVFMFDGFMTPSEFNTLRRLCSMWNRKTTGTNPK